MGMFEQLSDDLAVIRRRLDAFMDARESEAAERRRERCWASVPELARSWSLDPRSVAALVISGKEAGVVDSRVFRVTRGGKVLERVEVSSFERWLGMGGAACCEGRGAGDE